MTPKPRIGTFRLTQAIVGMGEAGDILPDVERTDNVETMITNGVLIEVDAKEAEQPTDG